MILMLATDTHTVHPACGRGGNENISNEAFSFMNQLGLRLIANIMNWEDDGVATAEYAWLRLMAATKYDGYSDFRAGSRFIESLATWLKQLDPEDRQTAYDFAKHRQIGKASGRGRVCPNV